MAIVREATSREERVRGFLAGEKLARLVEGFIRDGVAVLEGAIPHKDLDALAIRMDYDSAHRHAVQQNYTRSHGHLQQGTPRTAPWVLPSLVSNPLIEQIAIAVLGDAYLTFYNGNTALPGSVPQLLHSDVAWRYTSAEEAHAAGESWPPAPERVSFNVSCGDVTPHGGATEIWPGSQRDTVFMSTGKDAYNIEPEQQARRRAEGHTPLQNSVPKGGLVLRASTAWHRGMVNAGARPRHMVAISYASARVDRSKSLGGLSLTFSRSAAPAFDRSWWPAGAFEAIHGHTPRIDFNTAFVDAEEVDHMGHYRGEDCEDAVGDGAAAADVKGQNGPAKFGSGNAFWLPDADAAWADAATMRGEPEWARAAVQTWRDWRRSHDHVPGGKL